MKDKKSVVVINDKIGEMAFAFQLAGFNVLCDVLEEKSMEIVRVNLNIDVRKITEMSYLEIPRASMVVGRLEVADFLFTKGVSSERRNCINQNIYRYIEKYLPETFFMVAPKRYIDTEECQDWNSKCREYGYRIEYKVLSTAEVTGIPLREEHLYMIGIRNALDISDIFNVAKVDGISWRAILDENTEKPFLNSNRVKIKFDGDGIYDWKRGYYQKSETVYLQWRIPLIVKDGKMRFFSTKEIARLKGFRVNYTFLNKENSWLKRELCCSANLQVCRIIAERFLQIVSKTMSDNGGGCSESAKEKSAKVMELLDSAKDKFYCLEKGETEEMERRFDVFVSSTYQDLIEERKEITQAVLECDCMPVGMEMFPASNMEQWEFIKKVIDKADIYLVVVAGKYGTIGVDENGKRMSYTEMEFNYALSIGKPILGFIYKDIDKLTRDRIEVDSEKIEALECFCEKIKEGRLVKFFTNKDELKANVLGSINAIKKQITAGGWVRANQVSFDGKRELEIKNDELQGNNNKLKQEMQNLIEEKEQLFHELKKMKMLYQNANNEKEKIRMQYESVKIKIDEVVKEIEKTE